MNHEWLKPREWNSQSKTHPENVGEFLVLVVSVGEVGEREENREQRFVRATLGVHTAERLQDVERVPDRVSRDSRGRAQPEMDSACSTCSNVYRARWMASRVRVSTSLGPWIHARNGASVSSREASAHTRTAR